MKAFNSAYGRCARRYSRAFDMHNCVSVTINWLPPSSSPLLKPSKSKLLSLVSPLLIGKLQKCKSSLYPLNPKKSNDLPSFDVLPHASAVVFV